MGFDFEGLISMVGCRWLFTESEGLESSLGVDIVNWCWRSTSSVSLGIKFDLGKTYNRRSKIDGCKLLISKVILANRGSSGFDLMSRI